MFFKSLVKISGDFILYLRLDFEITTRKTKKNKNEKSETCNVQCTIRTQMKYHLETVIV